MARLLLVEDELTNRELFRRRLERKGYAVVVAGDGLTAVALTASEKPDLVLMDLGLPDIDGWEATRRIKADPATAAIPVVVLSAHATSDAKERAFAAGCQDFETKPVNWEGLFRKIEDWLAKAGEAAPRVAPLPTGTHPVLPAAAPDGGAQAVCAVAPKRILVVEDDAANRVMLCRRLNKHGYATTEAADGRQALALVAEQTFDLVLCDIVMPEADGYEVLRELKADPDLKALPVIMISAVDEVASVVRCIEMGAEDYLPKPYDPVLLHARITAGLDKRRLRDQELADLRAVADLTRAAELVERGAFDPALVAAVGARDDALGTLARAFDRMARAVQARTKQSQADMQQMTKVEIDRRELSHEVARVVASDAFDKARRRAEAVRARRPRGPAPLADTQIMKAPK